MNIYGTEDAEEKVSAPEDRIVARATRRFKEMRDHQSKWRDEAREDYAFYSGDQWDEQDKAVLRDQLRPIITFNRVGPVIDSVVGSEIANRQEVRFIPREIGDVGINELLTSAAQWVRDQSDAEDEESDAFLDCVICGLGWTETRMDYDENPDGEIVIDRVDPLEMYYDPSAKKKNLRDARDLARVRELTRDEFDEMFPGKREDIGSPDTHIEDLEDSEPDIVDPGDDYRTPDNAKPKSHYKVIEYQWCEMKTVYRVADPMTGRVADFPEEKFKKLSDRLAALNMPIRYVKQRKKCFYRAFICNGTLLEVGKAPSKKGFNYHCLTAKRDRNSGLWYGLVRAMKDPQKWANKWLSQVLHIINSNAKGGILAETDAFDNPRKAEEEWADPSAITWLRPGGRDKIQPKNPITYPSGLDKLMEFAVTSIRDVTGVNVELLGLADRQQAGVIENARKQAGFTILGTIFDALRRYRKNQGRTLLEFIQEYISDGRLIRVVSDEYQKYIPLVRQKETVEYDVIVDDAPTSPNQKEYVWATLMQLMPSLMRADLPKEVWAELVKYSPLPESVTSKVGAALMKPNPAAEQAQQMEQQKLQLEAQKVAADVEKTRAQAQATQADFLRAQAELRAGEMDAAKTAADIGYTRAKTQNENLDFFLKQHEAGASEVREARKDALEESRLALETLRQEQDHTRDMMKARQENKRDS